MSNAELTALRRQRAYRKGRINLLQKQLQTYEGTDVREYNRPDLLRLQKEVDHEAAAHTIAQDKIFEILYADDDEGAANSEQDVAESHADFYRKARQECENLLKNYHLIQDITQFEANVEEWLKFAIPDTKIFPREAALRISKMEDLQTRLNRCTLKETTNHLKGTLTGLHGQITRVIYKGATPAETKSKTSDSSDHQSRINIEPPTFNGDPLQWQSFKNLFDTTMETRAKHLDEAGKACLLLKSLRDSEAKELALMHTSGEKGFTRAMEALIERYGQPIVLLPKIAQQIQAPGTFTFTSESLFALSKQFCRTSDALEEMKIDLSTFLTALAALRFDGKLHEEWVKHTAAMKDLPNMETLRTYVKTMTARLGQEPPTTTTFKKPPHHRQKTSSSSLTSVVNLSNSTGQCTLCKGQVHSMQRCAKFVELTPERRSKFIKEQKWCCNCLHYSHIHQNCSSQNTCRHCGQRHHTLLHRGSTDSASPAGESTTAATNLSAPSRKTRSSSNHPKTTNKCDDLITPISNPALSCLHTALVDIYHQQRRFTSRIAFDSGASANFITDDMAARLRLKRFPQHLAFEGANSQGTSKFHVEATLRSRHNPAQTLPIKLSVISKLPKALPPHQKDIILSDSEISSLPLADEEFGGPLDILVGSYDYFKCNLGGTKFIDRLDVGLSQTIFGWTIVGKLQPDQTPKILNIQTTSDPLNDSLKRLWELEKTPEDDRNLSTEDARALEQFQDNHEILPSGRYQVRLPRPTNPPSLGTSRNLALKRYHANAKSLEKKGRLTEFNNCMREYLTLDHAEPAPPFTPSPINYLPVHGVFKESSTTTKLRPVFDASARTSNGISFNDTLLAGPNLYPQLPDILISFRTHLVGMSSDISKMFREIELHPDDRDVHRFLMPDSDGQPVDFRMKRLTFGVRPSPFLATQTIRHLAETHCESHPQAAAAILKSFYVDDFLGGADTIKLAQEI